MAKEIKDRESKTDIAYRIMQKRKKEIGFYELWDKIKEELAKELAPEDLEEVENDISFFYTNLTLDGRFVQLADNKWNLRERVKFDDIHMDMNDIYQEDEESETETEETEDYDTTDEFDESYDDSTGSDADISQFRDGKNDVDVDEDNED